MSAERSIAGSVEWTAPRGGVRYRYGTPQDARDIAELWQRADAARKGRRRRLRPAEVLEAVHERLSGGDGHFLLAFDGGALVGMVHAALVTRPASARGVASRQMHLSLLAVDPTYWRRGLGRELVGRGLVMARAKHAEAVRLWMHADNDRSAKFYHRLGFRFDHSWKLDLGGDLAVQYRYALDR